MKYTTSKPMNLYRSSMEFKQLKLKDA